MTNYFGFWRRRIGIKNKPLAIRAGDNPKFKNRKIINLKSFIQNLQAPSFNSVQIQNPKFFNLKSN
jgi:hypothetical protein